MSSVRLILIFALCTFFLANCEDKKKPSEAKVNPEKAQSEDLKSPVVTDSIIPDEEKFQYPEITNENVVAFFTQFGKDNPETKVRISTSYGEIDIELFNDAPRVVPNFIIQAGNSDHKSTPKKRREIGKTYLLPAEVSNGRIHTYGTVSGAKEYRKNPDRRTAPFEFFIFLGEKQHTTHLNGDYTVFGKVTKGMDVVETIANLPSDEDEWPSQNIYITAEVIH